ncbi:3-keto-disaccharide hydrolase [Parapedobacter sp.]
MYRKYPLAVLLMLFATASFAQFKALFNGKDLSGWTIHGTEKWYVENGELVCESGPDKQYGYLSTKTSYKDFELRVSFKLEANGNSGVFIRSDIEGVKIEGWQVEVAPPGNSTGGIYESYGRGWLIKPDPEKEKILKADEWNTMKIRAVGDKITTWLNGKKMVQLSDEKIGAAEGFIALQIHDGGGIKVRWKDLLIKEL